MHPILDLVTTPALANAAGLALAFVVLVVVLGAGLSAPTPPRSGQRGNRPAPFTKREADLLIRPTRGHDGPIRRPRREPHRARRALGEHRLLALPAGGSYAEGEPGSR